MGIAEEWVKGCEGILFCDVCNSLTTWRLFPIGDKAGKSKDRQAGINWHGTVLADNAVSSCGF
jgi:hypothetical protein